VTVDDGGDVMQRRACDDGSQLQAAVTASPGGGRTTAPQSLMPVTRTHCQRLVNHCRCGDVTPGPGSLGSP